MDVLPDFVKSDRVLPDALVERVEREKKAHEDAHIDDILRRWWGRFPHVFQNPAARALDRAWEEELGDATGKVVLEYGCGQGRFSHWLYGRGASLVGIDISQFNIERCEEYFAANGADASRYRFAVMDAHALQLGDASVDFVIGNGILHHLDLHMAFTEIDRVLKPGGKGLFIEPLGGHPVMKIYRKVSNYQTDDEQPLGRAELRYLREKWNARLSFSGIVTLPVAALTSLVVPSRPDNFVLRGASWLERKVNRLRSVETWNRNGLIVYAKQRERPAA